MGLQERGHMSHVARTRSQVSHPVKLEPVLSYVRRYGELMGSP